MLFYLARKAGRQQALYDAHMLGTQFGPAKKPILATHQNHPQRALQMVGVNRYRRIIEVDLQPHPPLAYVGQRRNERTVPNAKTIAAMKEARRDKLKTVTLGELQAVLDAEH